MGNSEPTGADAQEHPYFAPVKRIRSFDDVVDQVRRAIDEGHITAGERLPSERELAEQLGVSRATLREALRALEALGLLEIRLGAHGGAYARGTSGATLAGGISALLATEARWRPAETLLFRSRFHADNLGWAKWTKANLSALSAAADEGSSAFLVKAAELSGDPIRLALATALETLEGDADPLPSLTPGERQAVIDLLRSADVAGAQDLVHERLRSPSMQGSRR